MTLKYVELFRLGRGRTTGVSAVAFSSQGNFVATAGLDGKACIWDIADCTLLHMFSSAVPILSLTWAGEGEDSVICGLKDGTIACLMVTQLDLIVKGFWAHTYPVECLSVGDAFLTSGALEEVRVWRQRAGDWHREAELQTPPKTSFNRCLQVVVTSIHWINGSRGRQQLVVTYLNHGVHIFNAITWEQIRSVPIPGQIADASISHAADLIAISNVITGFDVYALESGAAICSFGHTVDEYRKVPVLFVHRSHALIGGNLRGNVHLWDMESGLKIHSLVHSTKDEILALGGSSDSALVVWKAEPLVPGPEICNQY
ncbi:WD40-repeat-containing domain protein [Trametes meyenii]|nr:WD40-repeat-containing domain protein [Trametes meyenii]